MAQPRGQASVCPRFDLWSISERPAIFTSRRGPCSLRPTRCPASHQHEPCSDTQAITREPNAASLRENVGVSAIGNEIRYELDEPTIGASMAETELGGG